MYSTLLYKSVYCGKELHTNVKTYQPKPSPYGNVCPGANTVFGGDALS